MTRKEKGIFDDLKNQATIAYFKIAGNSDNSYDMESNEYQFKLALAREKCLAYMDLEDALININNEVAD